MSALRGLVREHQLLSFFIIAFAVTWIAFIPFYAAGGEAIAWFTFGPLIAAIICTAVLGGWPGAKTFIASVFHWHVHPVWYVVAIGLPVAVQLLAILLNPLFGSAEPNWANLPPASQIAVTTAILLVFSGPLGEEPGWRGYALPRLLGSSTALNASLLLGVIWAAWHLPLALLGELSLSASIHAVIAAIVFTWLWQNTDSILLAVLMHASHQNSARFLGRVFDEADRVQKDWIGVSLWLAIAIAILAFYGPRSFVRGESVRDARKLA